LLFGENIFIHDFLHGHAASERADDDRETFTRVPVITELPPQMAGSMLMWGAISIGDVEALKTSASV
jgi:hypothetical protein